MRKLVDVIVIGSLSLPKSRIMQLARATQTIFALQSQDFCMYHVSQWQCNILSKIVEIFNMFNFLSS